MHAQGMAKPPPADTLVKIATGSKEELENLSLLFASLAINHALERSSGSLLVAAKDLERALYQWRLYAEENANWPTERPEPAPSHATTPPTLLLMAFLALFYAHTGPWQANNPWFSLGAVNSQAIVDQHEWWRLITALTLHADFSHLIGNILVGGISRVEIAVKIAAVVKVYVTVQFDIQGEGKRCGREGDGQNEFAHKILPKKFLDKR